MKKTSISKSTSGILQNKISDCKGDQKKLFKIVDTLLGRNKQLRYLSMIHLSLWLRYEKIYIDNIDNIQAEFPLLETNLPSYSFLSMDSIMSMRPTGLYHFDPVTDNEL